MTICWAGPQFQAFTDDKINMGQRTLLVFGTNTENFRKREKLSKALFPLLRGLSYKLAGLRFIPFENEPWFIRVGNERLLKTL